jgi:hypothetical protein
MEPPRVASRARASVHSVMRVALVLKTVIVTEIYLVVLSKTMTLKMSSPYVWLIPVLRLSQVKLRTVHVTVKGAARSPSNVLRVVREIYAVSIDSGCSGDSVM